MKFVDPSKAPPTMNILLYGPPGTGKSVGACSAPGPVLVLNAEGPGALRFARGLHGEGIREATVESGATLDEAYLYLKEGKGKERSVVVDTLGEVYRILLEELAGGGRPSLQNYGDVNTKLERFIRALRDLELNVILVAHEQLDDAEGEATRRPATGGKKLPEQVMAQVDVVAYTGVVPASEDAPARFVGQLVEGSGRRAKDRTGALGTHRDLDLSEWIEVGTKSMAGVEKSAKAPSENKPSTEEKESK